MDLGISGKWAIVCASSKGLGFGCAKALAVEGVNVVINSRSEESLEKAENSKIFKPGLDGDQVTVYPVAPPESSNSIASISP